MGRFIAVALVAVGAIALFMHGDLGRVWGLDTQEFAAVAAFFALVLLIVPALFGAYHGRFLRALRDGIVWAALGLVLLAGYSFREEISTIAYRIAGELTPPGTVTSVETNVAGELAVRIRRRPDSHFVATVSINGASVPMLVDTGASTVVLRQADARKLGIDIANLRYTVPVQTANGLAYAAHVRLRAMTVGSITLKSVDALIAQPGALKESLLGMSFLSRLRSYEFAGNFLTLRN